MTVSTLVAEVIPADLSHTDGANGTVTRVVVHGTVSPCVPNGARNNAHYFQTKGAGGAAHYTVDPREAINCVDEDVIAYHAPPNAHSIGVELCDRQDHVDLWGDQDHKSMLALGAKLVADICDRHGIPKVWLSVDDLLAGKLGVTSHANVAAAWRQSDHTDPQEFFPVDSFMASVNGTAAPTPEAPVQETTFIAEFNDQPGTLWLVKVEPEAPASHKDDDPTGRYGTRTRVVNPDWFWALAEIGIPVRSGRHNGMGLYREVI